MDGEQGLESNKTLLSMMARDLCNTILDLLDLIKSQKIVGLRWRILGLSASAIKKLSRMKVDSLLLMNKDDHQRLESGLENSCSKLVAIVSAIEKLAAIDSAIEKWTAIENRELAAIENREIKGHWKSMGLSARTATLLAKYKIKSLDQLNSNDWEELFTHKGFGPLTRKEMTRFLKKKGVFSKSK